MNKKLLIFILIVIFILLLVIFRNTEPEKTDYTIEQARNVAEAWIKNSSSTYIYDGYDLELLSEEQVKKDTYEFLFSFETRTAGYGDRTDQMVAQVITPREILVLVEKDEVVKAITDGVYNELEEKMLEDGVQPETMMIELYFGQYGQDTDIFLIQREVEKRQDVAMIALEELLKGPTQEEENYFTSIPEGVQVQSLIVEDGIAKVDFSSELDEVAGSATVIAIREQIEKTLLQFPTVEQVVISIDNRTEDILQP